MPLAEVLRALAADEGIVDELVAAARAHSPEVARLPAAETRRHVADLLAAGLAAFGRSGADDFTAAASLGADRAAQGVPITALLSGVRAGRGRIVEIAVARGRSLGVPDSVLLEALLELDRYTAALERHVVGGYQSAQRELGRDTRSQLLRRLFHADSVPADELAQAGLHPDGRYFCLVSDVTDPVRARTLELSGVLGLVDGRLAGLAPVLPAAVDALVVASPAAPLPQVPALYALCTTALAVASPRTGLHLLTDLAPQAALAAQPVLAALLADTLLAALDPADEFHRELAATALSYVDHGRRMDHTAAALHVHANTVRYRLARLRALTGMPEDGETMADSLRWWWALRTWLG